ncbi:MAG TPA: PQQ-dependent sugar dehydrogenase [Polyangia bacterium]|nr:PQQ-dependent sugar dehydrogenase [Polyangia bacterium]
MTTTMAIAATALLPLALAGASDGGRAGTPSSARQPPPAQAATPTAAATPSPAVAAPPAASASVFSDFRNERAGAVHHIRARDLPAPHATPSVDNGARVIDRPTAAWPQAPAGFKVELHADKLSNPRLIRTAPNGDLFVAESKADQIRVLRGVGRDGRAQRVEVFARDLKQPFGIAFYPPGNDPRWVYVGNTDSVWRYPYRNGDLTARAAHEVVSTQIPGGGRLRGGGHWTRDVAFSADGKKLFVSVGSRSNNDDTDDNHDEFHRAQILEMGPDGSGLRTFASGIRNPVGIAIQPRTGDLWTSVNERDLLGDDLVPDYITRVSEGGFYGWPWYYIGGNQDPRHAGKHPELRDKVIVPDVLLQPHHASLALTFYDGKMFPAEYQGDVFAAQHGSWNRNPRTGYNVIRVPLHQSGRASGEYQDFLTGFVTADGQVWGRPVGVAVAADGALMVSDDGSNSIWRVSRSGK